VPLADANTHPDTGDAGVDGEYCREMGARNSAGLPVDGKSGCLDVSKTRTSGVGAFWKAMTDDSETGSDGAHPGESGSEPDRIAGGPGGEPDREAGGPGGEPGGTGEPSGESGGVVEPGAEQVSDGAAATARGPAKGAPSGVHRVARGLATAALVLVLSVGAVAASLWLTPMQQVSTAGQTVGVGVTGPSWSLSGPGEVDLFGQQLPTVVDFVGPVRPRLELRRIAVGEQLAQFAASGSKEAVQALQSALLHGWVRFFIWQLAVAVVIAVLISGAAAGWLRRRWGRTVGLIIIGVVATLVIDGGAVMVTAFTAPAKLKSVRSLQDLAGATQLPDLPSTAAVDRSSIKKVVVIGDSTAAGLGNPIVADPSRADSVCGRSRDSFAAVLAAANGWEVTNLACSKATMRTGLLGPEPSLSMTLPPQVGEPAVSKADLVIVSIGANDVDWTNILRICSVSDNCANSAEQAYFQQQLAHFSTDLLQLVAALQQLPRHPGVIINQYYDPFPDDISCLANRGITKDKQQTLQSDLAALNAVLAAGAKAAGFSTVGPDFTGHGVCSTYPYVQGLDAVAPLHPTAAGQMAIALADEYATRAVPR